MLSRRVGVHHLSLVEDAVQTALMAAVQAWPQRLPDDRRAWLHRVAYNALMGDLRQRTSRRRLLQEGNDDAQVKATAVPPPTSSLAGEMQDDMLRMLFVCCDDVIPPKAQLPLALKTLCGLGVREIAQGLFLSEDNVYKRLQRGRAKLREHPEVVEVFNAVDVKVRVPAVLRVLYLMFTEGHLTSSPDEKKGVRLDLCAEAVRLTSMLYAHPLGRSSTTAALLALMHFHLARLPGRLTDAGGVLLLEEQDRQRWDQDAIGTGLQWMQKAATDDDAVSRYHLEATIAAEHCLAPSTAQTAWRRIADSYALLETLAPSPMHRLGRALATAEADCAEAGLALLQEVEPPTWMQGATHWWATLADLQRRAGRLQEAEANLQLALKLAPTDVVRALLRRRWQA